MGSRTVKDAQISEINITPLTDIFLVLLIIMIVVAPVTDFAGLNLGVVSVGPAPDPKVKPKTLKICLEQSGDVRVADKTLNNRNELVQTIQNDLPNFPDGVIIEVDPETNQDFLAFVMNAVGKAGVKTKVALRELKTDTKKKP